MKPEIAYDLMARLAASVAAGYGRSTLPGPLDNLASQLVAAFCQATGDQRQTMSQQVSSHISDVLLAYSERMASLAVREQRRSHIVNGLVALGLGFATHDDPRDAIVIMALHYHSAAKIGVSPEGVCRESEAYLSVREVRVFEEFMKRQDEDRELDAMGYVEGRDLDGCRYQRTW